VEAPTGRQLQQFTPSGDTGVVQKMRFSADSKLLAVVYGPGDNQRPAPASPGSYMRGSQVKIWDVKSGRELHSLVSDGIPGEAEFSSDGSMIATISAGVGLMSQISLWDVQSGSKLRDLTTAPASSFTPPVFNPGQIKRGQMPQMPNMADMATMMTNIM